MTVAGVAGAVADLGEVRRLGTWIVASLCFVAAVVALLVWRRRLARAAELEQAEAVIAEAFDELGDHRSNS